MSDWIDVAALGRVLLASLVAGVGLVSLFGLGLVGLSRGQSAQAAQSAGPGSSGQRVRSAGSPAWLLLAGLCFLAVLAGIGLGLYSILTG